MENPIEMDDLGGTPIFGNTYFTLANKARRKCKYNREEHRWRCIAGADQVPLELKGNRF